MVGWSTLFTLLLGLPLGVALVVFDRGGLRPVPALKKSAARVRGERRAVAAVHRADDRDHPVHPARHRDHHRDGRVRGAAHHGRGAVLRPAGRDRRCARSARTLVQAAQAMGANRATIVRKVLLPEALPGLIAGPPSPWWRSSATPPWPARSAGRAGGPGRPLRLPALRDAPDDRDRRGAARHRAAAAEPGRLGRSAPIAQVRKNHENSPLCRCRSAGSVARLAHAVRRSPPPPAPRPPRSADAVIKVGANPVPHGKILNFVKQNLAPAAGLSWRSWSSPTTCSPTCSCRRASSRPASSSTGRIWTTSTPPRAPKPGLRRAGPPGAARLVLQEDHERDGAGHRRDHWPCRTTPPTWAARSSCSPTTAADQAQGRRGDGSHRARRRRQPQEAGS